MSKKWTLVITFVVVIFFSGIKGNPMIEAQNRDANTTDLKIAPRIGDWMNFSGKWSFPSFTSVSSYFTDDSEEKAASLVKKRIDVLERAQKEIIAMMKKLTRDFGAFSTLLKDKKFLDDKKPIEPILQVGSVNKEKTASTQEKTTASTISETVVSEKEGHTPRKDEKPEVTTKPVSMEESITPKDVKPNISIEESTKNNNEQEVTIKPVEIKNPVARKDPKPNLPNDKSNKNYIMKITLPEKESSLGRGLLVGFSGSNGRRPNGRMPWNKDNEDQQNY